MYFDHRVPVVDSWCFQPIRKNILTSNWIVSPGRVKNIHMSTLKRNHFWREIWKFHGTEPSMFRKYVSFQWGIYIYDRCWKYIMIHVYIACYIYTQSIFRGVCSLFNLWVMQPPHMFCLSTSKNKKHLENQRLVHRSCPFHQLKCAPSPTKKNMSNPSNTARTPNLMLAASAETITTPMFFGIWPSSFPAFVTSIAWSHQSQERHWVWRMVTNVSLQRHPTWSGKKTSKDVVSLLPRVFRDRKNEEKNGIHQVIQALVHQKFLGWLRTCTRGQASRR